MKFGVLSNVFCRYSIERAFKEISRSGYDGIELWGGRPHGYPYDMDEDNINKIKKLSKDYNLPICCYTPETLMYPYNIVSKERKEREETVKYLKKSLDIANAIEAPRMMITVGHGGYERDRENIWKELVKNIKKLTEYAEKKEVDIVLEPLTPYESNMVLTTDDISRLINEVDSKRLKTMVDLVAPISIREPIGDYFEKLKDKLSYIHLIDGDSSSDTHMMLGEGIIPFKEFFQKVKEYNYKGYLTIELGSAYIHDPSLYIDMAMNKIKGYLE